MNKNNDVMMYQVSTLQALVLGHTRPVVDVGELKAHGSMGLGTFEGVNGEMIMLEGCCYRAIEDGTVYIAEDDMGVPFSSVCGFKGSKSFDIGSIESIDKLKTMLNNKIEEDFGLNSMHMVRIDGAFEVVDARSESEYNSIHVSQKDMLDVTQKAFVFNDIKGTLVCVYYPDYMDGINAAGWHIHFVSDDRTKGGHVFDIKIIKGQAKLDKINRIELQLPSEPVFDTYSLKDKELEKDIKSVEQGKKPGKPGHKLQVAEKYKYMRIQGRKLAANTMYAKGIFSMAWKLITDKKMDEEDADLYREIDAWFAENLPFPEPCMNKEKVVCFFKTSNYDEMMKMIRPALWLLERYNEPYYLVYTNTPGEIIYEDAYQIVVKAEGLEIEEFPEDFKTYV